MDFKDYYHILGLEPDADDKSIKAAYRKLARKYHPDVSREDGAEQKFKEVAEAYEVLKDPEKRAEYDQLRRYRQGGFESQPGRQQQRRGGNADGFHAEFGDQAEFSEFFEDLFGGGRFHRGPGPRAGRDAEVDLPLFLEDTVADATKQVHLAVPQYDDRGRRLADKERILNVKVPAGTADNERIRLKGQGGPGIGGGPPGDLFLRVRLVPHPLFDVDGHDLIITVPVAPWEAALGTRVEVPTLSGRIKLTLPAGSQAGRRLRIKGKGLAGKNGSGDLYAVLKVVMPDTVTGQQQDLWNRLAESSDFDPRAGWGQ